MSKGFLVIDGNALAHAAAAKEKLHVGGVEVQVIYHFLRMLRPLVARFAQLTPIVLWDGRSWRYDRFPDYKASRNKEPETAAEIKMAKLRNEVKRQRKHVQKALELLGVRQISALNLEADDLAGGMVRKFGNDRSMLLVTRDNDWLQLVRPRVTWYDPIADKMIGLKTFEERTGLRSPRAFLEQKALTGDDSDEIPGVGGIGEKGALELLTTYRSVGDFLNMSIDGSLPELPKKFAAFAEQMEKQEIYRRNLMLMDLMSPLAPKPINLKMTAKPMNIAGFEKFCRILVFKSVLTDLEGWCEPFKRSAT